MDGRRFALSSIILLILSGFSSGIVAASNFQNSEDNEKTISSLNNFYQSDYELRESSGLIHSPYGSFDPLFEPIPIGPENLYDQMALERTGFLIVQSKSANLNPVLSLVSEMGLYFQDYMPDDVIIVRIPSQIDTDIVVSALENSEEIRWVGELPIAWRVSSEITRSSGRANVVLDLDIIPAEGITDDELIDLASDLYRVSDKVPIDMICDSNLCQPRSVNAIWIPILAMDGRILHIQEASRITIHNSNAADISGVSQAFIASSNTLNGTGEVIAISDTGLDSNHGDFDGRIRGIYNQFGPDNSAADMNSGHGTHVTATILGDGTGDSSAQGMVPSATFHFYQLEVDSSGILARWGSLYDMFEHAWDNSARIQTNSWGNENLVGQYSGDSRSADQFIVDNPKFLVLFSSGELGSDGANTVTPPGTAKNVLTIGASTTGSMGGLPEGSVASFSSSGETLDGRIKPDLVAPGVLLCSARAEEASNPQGMDCSDSTHSDGATPLYIAMNGTSMATAVAAGGATQVRQHLREVAGISEPRSDLIKALLINGAKDIGDLNIPNSFEGWGQIDVANSISPMDGSTSLDLLYDDSQVLDPGHSFVYTFSVNSNSPFDITLNWVDREASSISNQTATKLVNDLDLIVTSPDGTQYFGNQFSNGESFSGGVIDNKNNVERVKISNPEVGTWSVRVGHSGGFTQGFALVTSGAINEMSVADLSVFEGSLSTSVENPLQGDLILIEAAWRNQASLGTGSYSVEVNDLTEGTVLYTSQQGNLQAGATTSIVFPHSFQTTGDHIIEVVLDTGGEVSELNDEINGIDNNRYEMIVEVSQIGVRITPLMDDGTIPITNSELEEALSRTLDPRNGGLVSYEFELRNEGTSPVSVGLSVTPMQFIDEQGILQAPDDEWWKLLNESGPWDLEPSGETGDSVIVTLNLENVDVDLTDSSGARYAIPGTFVNDVNLFDRNAPTISHSIRITTIVERVEGLYTILAGTGSDLGAEPGNFASYSLSIRNTGNGPTQYSVQCTSASNWIINIGSSQSNSVILDPLSRLQFLPLPIHVLVPTVNQGDPAAGITEEVTCVTTSIQDNTVSTTEIAIVNVFENNDFSVDLLDESGQILGPLALAEDRASLNGDMIETSVIVSNDGNVDMNFEMTASSSLNTWNTQIVHGEETSIENKISFSINAGDSTTLIVQMIVPLNAEMGAKNTLTIRTTLNDGVMVTNGTRFIVQEVAALETSEGGIIPVSLGRTGTADISVRNSGNVPLYTQWTIGSLPEGWVGGFQSLIPTQMEMNREAIVTVGLILPANLPVGVLDQQVSIILEATTPGGETVVHTYLLYVEVVASVWVGLTSDPISMNDVNSDSNAEFSVTVTNLGNVPSGFTVEAEMLEDWDISVSVDSIESVQVGDSVELSVNAKPSSSADHGVNSFILYSNSTDGSDGTSHTDASIILEISRARDDSCSGFGCLLVSLGLPKWSLAIIFLVVIAGLGVGLIRMRKEGIQSLNPEEELIPIGSAIHAGSQSDRRAFALDTGSAGEALSSTISEEEISSVLSSSLPSLSKIDVPPGAMPLPLSGLPDGWTMEQWVEYGHLWYEENR
tara:strand:+ start:72299 stop:77065 length:4767 start_codon:yes stop_codon:yes gene_type:complete